jgi:hypothetical protein
MINYYDLTNEQRESMNVDYDFVACLEYNDLPFNLFDVERVLAVIEGENDTRDWHWIVKLRNDQTVYVRGGCDYTGWDCQSWAGAKLLDEKTSLVKAIHELGNGWESDDDKVGYYHNLSNQLAGKKKETWRELMDKEFGLDKDGNDE